MLPIKLASLNVQGYNIQFIISKLIKICVFNNIIKICAHNFVFYNLHVLKIVALIIYYYFLFYLLSQTNF